MVEMKDKRYHRSYQYGKAGNHPYKNSHHMNPSTHRSALATTCSICNTAVSKYKCPYCPTIQYCTLHCYKKHQTLGCSRNDNDDHSNKEEKNENQNEDEKQDKNHKHDTMTQSEASKKVVDKIPNAPSNGVSHTPTSIPIAIPSTSTPASTATVISTLTSTPISTSTSTSTSTTIPLRDDVVTPQQLHRLATDESMVTSLRNIELQHIIRTIDSSRDRMGALEKYLRHNKDFHLFVNRMMDTIDTVEDR